MISTIEWIKYLMNNEHVLRNRLQLQTWSMSSLLIAVLMHTQETVATWKKISHLLWLTCTNILNLYDAQKYNLHSIKCILLYTWTANLTIKNWKHTWINGRKNIFKSYTTWYDKDTQKQIISIYICNEKNKKANIKTDKPPTQTNFFSFTSELSNNSNI